VWAALGEAFARFPKSIAQVEKVLLGLTNREKYDTIEGLLTGLSTTYHALMAYRRGFGSLYLEAREELVHRRIPVRE